MKNESDEFKTLSAAVEVRGHHFARAYNESFLWTGGVILAHTRYLWLLLLALRLALSQLTQFGAEVGWNQPSKYVWIRHLALRFCT